VLTNNHSFETKQIKMNKKIQSVLFTEEEAGEGGGTLTSFPLADRM
jgi:hypothetical protein